MKYLKLFENKTNYDSFVESSDYITPNVSLITEGGSVEFNAYVAPPAKAGDVAYWDGSKVQTCTLENYSTSMGTAVGVVVIPKGMLPDGIRIIALEQTSKRSWGDYVNVSNLNDYRVQFPTTDNTNVLATSKSTTQSYLPSDKFTGITSFVDPISKYSNSSYVNTNKLVPSPYLNDSLNSEYVKNTGWATPLSDFNGSTNTDLLVNSETNYNAANDAANYKVDSINNVKWYLPALGELGIMLARLGQINTTLSFLGKNEIPNGIMWSSTENTYEYAFFLNTFLGEVYSDYKGNSHIVWPFAKIDL